jgi:NAD-dependent SIR2 family protein deacetylase
MQPDALETAVDAIADADAILIGAGAGMGVDSGLPDFRGGDGFWNSYPPFEERGLDFQDLANPVWFDDDPELAWGFYGHRLHLYRDTEPHDGFEILRSWIDRLQLDPFVFTSNVDGHFQKSGFDDDHVIECHGSIHHLQCARPCQRTIWSAESTHVDVDRETFRADSDPPTCPSCGGVARPNILMFADTRWIAERTSLQRDRFQAWVRQLDSQSSHVVIECGAGTAVPTVRRKCERIAGRPGGTLIRINPDEAHAPSDAVSLEAGALEVLRAIDARISS